MLEEIFAFCIATSMKFTDFGAAALNDPRLVHDLYYERKLSASEKARLRTFMDLMA